MLRWIRRWADKDLQHLLHGKRDWIAIIELDHQRVLEVRILLQDFATVVESFVVVDNHPRRVSDELLWQDLGRKGLRWDGNWDEDRDVNRDVNRDGTGWGGDRMG